MRIMTVHRSCYDSSADSCAYKAFETVKVGAACGHAPEHCQAVQGVGPLSLAQPVWQPASQLVAPDLPREQMLRLACQVMAQHYKHQQVLSQLLQDHIGQSDQL